MSRTANKGEWSEIYAFFKILSDRVLNEADENEQPIEGKTFDVLSVIRSEKEGGSVVTRNYDLTQGEGSTTISSDNAEGTTVVNLEKLRNGVRGIFEAIKTAGGASFPLPEAEAFMETLHCTSIKASSADKTDIRLVIQDRFSHGNVESGFSIKTDYKALPTLLNSSKGNTNFLYKVVKDGAGTNDSGSSTNTVRDTVKSIYDVGRLEFVEVESPTFRTNLEFVDSTFPRILATMLSLYHRGAARSVAELTELLPSDPSLQDSQHDLAFYQRKVKDFLEAVALGMTPAKPWSGLPQANGGYIVVKSDGELVCYHRADRERFLDYLYTHTRFDTPSTTRHGYGSIETGENGDEFIKLNIQIRFI